LNFWIVLKIPNNKTTKSIVVNLQVSLSTKISYSRGKLTINAGDGFKFNFKKQIYLRIENGELFILKQFVLSLYSLTVSEYLH